MTTFFRRTAFPGRERRWIIAIALAIVVVATTLFIIIRGTSSRTVVSTTTGDGDKKTILATGDKESPNGTNGKGDGPSTGVKEKNDTQIARANLGLRSMRRGGRDRGNEIIYQGDKCTFPVATQTLFEYGWIYTIDSDGAKFRKRLKRVGNVLEGESEEEFGAVAVLEYEYLVVIAAERDQEQLGKENDSNFLNTEERERLQKSLDRSKVDDILQSALQRLHLQGKVRFDFNRYEHHRGMRPPFSENKQSRGPAALIIAMEGYPGNKALKQPINSGLDLANRLLENGYSVTFISDMKHTDNPLRGKGVDIIEENSSQSLSTKLDNWIDENFSRSSKKSPFGIMTFSGHGKIRRTKDGRDFTYFICPNDMKAIEAGDMEVAETAGFNFDVFREDLGKKLMPLLIAFDACRETPMVDDVLKNYQGTLGTVLAEKARDRYARLPRSDVRLPTTIWASPVGMVVNDKPSDLVSMLAQGLERHNVFSSEQYRAHFQRDPFVTPPITLERETDVSFFTWCNFAIRHLNASSENQQPPYIDAGILDQGHIFASTDLANRKAIFEAAPIINLMPGSKVSGIARNFNTEYLPEGIRVTRPAKSGLGWGSIDLSAPGFDPEGNSLIIEVVASSNGNAAAGKTMSLLVQPNRAANPPFYFSTKWNRDPKKLEYDTTTAWRIPLDNPTPPDPESGNKLLNVAFSAVPNQEASWPERASITITRMSLVDDRLFPSERKSNKEMVEVTPVTDLITRWWFFDILRKSESNARISGKVYRTEKNRLQFHLKIEKLALGEQAGRGGGIFPYVFLDAETQELEVKLADLKVDVKTTFAMSVHGREIKTITKQFNVEPKDVGEPLYIELAQSGFIDYIGVTSGATTNLAIVSLSVVPKKKVQ